MLATEVSLTTKRALSNYPSTWYLHSRMRCFASQYILISSAPGRIDRVKVKVNATAHAHHVDDICMSVPIGGRHERRSRNASGDRTGL